MGPMLELRITMMIVITENIKTETVAVGIRAKVIGRRRRLSRRLRGNRIVRLNMYVRVSIVYMIDLE